MNRMHILSCEFSNKAAAASHFHADYELLYVMKGELSLISNGKAYPLGEEDFFLINTGIHHSWTGEGTILTGSILIDIEQISALFGSTPVLFDCYSRTMRPEETLPVRELVNQLFTYHNATEGQGRLMFNSLSYQLLHLLTSGCLAQKDDPVWNFPQDGPQKRNYDILRYVNENYAQPISLTSLAKHLNLTTPYLSKTFKDQFGTTFLSYLQTIRLKHAADDILHSEKSLTGIALDNGFPNPASFIRKFKQVYGLTPREYRKTARGSDTSSSQLSAQAGKTVMSDESVTIKEPVMSNKPVTGHEPVMNEYISAMVHAYFDSHRVQPHDATSSNQEHICVSQQLQSVQANRLFSKPWMKLLNAGNAASLLRYDVREQVKQLHEELHFEYLYIGNLLHPSMNIYPEDPSGKPNFSEIRKILDFVVSLGMHPYIELESQEPDMRHEINSHIVEATIHSQLEYLYKNYELFDSLISFLIRRYGQEELSNWRISLEHSTAINNRVSDRNYFKYFSSIYRILKKRIPSILIGGPGFTIDFSEERIETFLRNWLAAGGTPDFINLYVFPYTLDLEYLKEGKNVASADRRFLANTLDSLNHVMQRLQLSDLETHVTIWNSTISNRNPLNDSCFKASYIMNALLGSWDKCRFIGYWNASDISVLDTDVRLPFFGGNGLLTQNGLKKPAYHAFRFMNQLYPYCLACTEHAVVTANDHGRFAICCHNYKHYNHLYYLRPENRLRPESLSLYYEDYDNLVLTITICDLPEGSFMIRKRFVSEHVGNIQDSWLKLSKQEELSNFELNYLNAQSEPGLSYTKQNSVNGRIVLKEILRPQEICVIMIEQIYD